MEEAKSLFDKISMEEAVKKGQVIGDTPVGQGTSCRSLLTVVATQNPQNVAGPSATEDLMNRLNKL